MEPDGVEDALKRVHAHEDHEGNGGEDGEGEYDSCDGAGSEEHGYGLAEKDLRGDRGSGEPRRVGSGRD